MPRRSIRSTSRAPRNRDHRAAILAAARQRYARFGPRKTTMAEVAREAGCSRATLYNLFPGKSELYAGLLQDEIDAFQREARAAAESPGRSPARKLAEILAATLRAFSASPVLRGAVSGDEAMSLERVAGPLLETAEAQVTGLLRDVLAEGIASGRFRAVDPDAVAYLMFQLGRVLVAREVEGRADYPLAQILGAMDDVIAHGIGATADPR